jgi:hypothetical protein
MFGKNLDNNRFYSLLKNAENKTFHSSNADVEPTDGSGKYTKVKWQDNVSQYMYQAHDGLGWGFTKFQTSKCVIQFLKASDKNNLNRIAKTTHGIKFQSLNPDEDTATDDCSLGTEYVDGINNPKDPSKIQDDSNGDMGTLTDDGTGGEIEPEEDKTLLYGGIGVGVLALILVMRK